MASKYAIETIFRAIDKITAPVDKMGKKINKFGAIGEITNSKLKKSFVSAEKTLGKIGVAAKKAVAGLAVASVAAAGAFAGTGIKNMMEFETGLAKIGTIADKSAMSMQAISDGILKLSKVTGVSVNELAESQYQAISAGIDTAKSLDFVSIAVKAAKGGFTDTATAVDALSTVLNAYNLSANDAMKISDQMLMAQNLGKTTFGDMSSSLGNVIPIAASLKVKTEELFAAIAALTAAGIQTPQAITGLKAAFSNIQKPTKTAADLAERLGLDFSAAALQSKGLAGFLEDVAKATGVTVSGLQEMVEQANGDSEALAKLIKASGGGAEQLAQLFGSVEALNAITVLTGTGAERFTNALSSMGNAAGATDAAFNTMMATFSEKFKKIQNILRNAGIKFGMSMAPVLDKLASKFEVFAEKIDSMDFVPIAAKIGGAIDIIIGIGTVIWNLRAPILAVTGAVLAFKVAMIGIVAFTKAYNAVMTVAKGLQIAYALVTKKSAAAQAALAFETKGVAIVTQIWSGILKAGMWVKQGILLVALKVKMLALAAATKIVAAAQAVWNGIMAVFNVILAANPIGLIILAVVALIAIIFLCVKNWDKICAVMRTAWDWVKKVAAVIRDGLVGAFKACVQWVLNAANAFKEHLLGALLSLWDPIRNISTAFRDGGILAGIKQIGAAILNCLLIPLQTVLGLLSKIPGVGGLFSGMNDGIDGIIDALSFTASTDVPQPEGGGDPVAGYGPVTQGERIAYSREESVSRSEMMIGLDKGLTARVSGSAPGISVRTAASGAF